MPDLNPHQFQSEADRSIADMQRQIEGARASFGTRPPSSFDEGTPQPEPVNDHARGFYRKDYTSPGQRSTHYEYKTGEHDGRHSVHATSIVHHKAPSAHYSYAKDEPEPEPRIAAHRINNHSWTPDSEKDRLQSIVDGQPKLFGSSHSPGRSEVFSLFSTKETSVHAGTMLGIAGRQTALEEGRTLTPPDDLSQHSSRIVQNLKGKGAVDEAAPTTVTNDYEHYSEPEWSYTTAQDRIADDEVAKGRSTMRQVLRQGKPRRPRETYTQERLL